jgi:hypothetical protein
VESVEAGEYIELLIKDGAVAQVTHLTRIYRNVLVALLPLLFPQDLSVARVLFQLLLY